MVLAYGDMDGRGVAARDKEVTSGFFACVVVEDFLCAAAEDYHIFTGHGVPMDGDDRTGLDGIQHPLRLVFGRIAEVVVHPKTGRGLSLGGQLVKNSII